jgi:subfamily B ATP-binding cassette protein MsbA
MGMVAAERIFEILETHSNIEDKGTLKPSQINGNICLEKLGFSYIQGERIINDISLEIKSGETIALVGATGAGKSTIINLISRFYEFDSGDITIDGISIRKYDLNLYVIRFLLFFKMYSYLQTVYLIISHCLTLEFQKIK